MIKPTLLISAVLILVAAVKGVKVEGVSPVTIGKKASAYPMTCGTDLKLTVAGPTSLIVDVRGKSDALGKPFEVDFTRNEKAVSKNNVTLVKKKDAGKGFAGMAQLVLPVPDGEQHYTVSCDGLGEIAMSFRLSKKPANTNLAAPEVPAEKSSAAAAAAKGVDGGKPPEATAAADGGAPPAAAAAAAGGGSNQAYPGLFTHVGF